MRVAPTLGMATFATALIALGIVLGPTSGTAEGDPVEPSRPGLIKRSLASFLTDDDGKKGKDARGLHLGPFAPRVDIVSSGAGPAPILHFWAPDIGSTPIDLHASASYSTHKYLYYDAQFGLVPHEGERLPRIEKGTSGMFPLSDLEKTAAVPGFDVYASARFRDYPREDFYGVGSESLRADRTDYGLKDALYEGIVRVRIARLSLMGRAGLLQTSISPGADGAFPNTELLNDEVTAPGLLRAPDFLHVSAGAWLELRDAPDNPHRGVSLGCPTRASTIVTATRSSSSACSSTPGSSSRSARIGTCWPSGR